MSRTFPSDPRALRSPATDASAPVDLSAPSTCVRHTYAPGPSVPEPRGVPAFEPLRVRGRRDRLRRAVLRRRRVVAAGLAVTAAALAAAGAGGATGTAQPLPAGSGPHPGAREPGTTESAGAAAARPTGDPGPSPAGRSPDRAVSAPVRIADAATVGLLHAGDRVDVIATPVPPPNDSGGGRPGLEARIIAAGVRVEEVPDMAGDGSIDGGALLVLSVTRQVAAQLASASAVSQLAVTLC